MAQKYISRIGISELLGLVVFSKIRRCRKISIKQKIKWELFCFFFLVNKILVDNNNFNK